MSKRLVVPVLFALLALACDSPTAAPGAADGVIPAPSASVIPGVTSEEGVLGPGALYEILVPDAWNGTLVLYAHGYRDGDVVRLPDLGDPTDADGAVILGLTQLGFATAFSSFSENGLAIKDGTQRTEQLRGIFVSKFGHADRTLAVGGSLGGAVALKMIEEHPQHYAGGVTFCGLIGGSQAELDYMSNVRVLFDVFYPGVIPGDLMHLPPVADRPAALAAAQGAMLADATGAFAMQAIMAGLGRPIPGSGGEVLQSIYVALVYNLTRFDDVLARTSGKSFFDNTGTDYGDPWNGMVGRFTSHPSAVNYLRHYYEPSGELEIPLVTLHNADDPAVPVFHETLYGQAVAATGDTGLLTQIIVPGYGHCVFTPDEAFGALSLLLSQIGP